jgi:hypothetical protein
MNLEEIRNILTQFTDRDFRPEEFDTLIETSQRTHFRNMAGLENETALRPFKVHKGIDDGTPPLFFTNGVAPMPSDFFAYKSAFNIVDGEPRQAEEVPDWEFDNRRQHSIETPTKLFPLINLQSHSIRVLPKDVQYLTFEYIKVPTAVHFGFSNTKGYVEYDPLTSVELEWDDANQIEIIGIALNTLGIQATPEDIKQKAK